MSSIENELQQLVDNPASIPPCEAERTTADTWRQEGFHIVFPFIAPGSDVQEFILDLYQEQGQAEEAEDDYLDLTQPGPIDQLIADRTERTDKATARFDIVERHLGEIGISMSDDRIGGDRAERMIRAAEMSAALIHMDAENGILNRSWVRELPVLDELETIIYAEATMHAEYIPAFWA